MDALVKLVRTYRFAGSLDERMRLGEEIFSHVEPKLRYFAFASIRRPAVAQDVTQDILLAVITSLASFEGSSPEEFWGWCYRIARNKLNDHFRRQSSEALHFEAVDPEVLWPLLEDSAAAQPLSPGDRLDLDHALRMLAQAKPECRDFLWRHYVFGMTYAEIAEQTGVNYDAARMKITRCLEEAQSLVA